MPPHSKNLFKNGKIITKREGTRPKPSKENNRSKNQLRESIIWKTTSIPKEVKFHTRGESVYPNCTCYVVTHICQLICATVSFSKNMR